MESMHSFSNPYIFPAFFIIMWLCVSFLLNLASGWKELAKTYTYQNETIIHKKNFQWANIQGVNYKRCVTIGANTQGLYLSLLFLFSAGSPSLFIPWKEIKITKKKYWWFPVFELDIAGKKIMVLQSLEKFLLEASGGSFVA